MVKIVVFPSPTAGRKTQKSDHDLWNLGTILLLVLVDFTHLPLVNRFSAGRHHLGGGLDRVRVRERDAGAQQPEGAPEEELRLPGERPLPDPGRQGHPLARLHHQTHRPL